MTDPISFKDSGSCLKGTSELILKKQQQQQQQQQHNKTKQNKTKTKNVKISKHCFFGSK